MLKKNLLSLALMVNCFLAPLTQAFAPDVDYQVLTISPIPAALLPQKPANIKVVEFFSYACPWCYKLDPALDQWLKTKPAQVQFERIPVLFQPLWLMFNKVFYIAKDLQVENKLHKEIFDTVQASYPEDPSSSTPFSILKAADFSTDQGISAFFIKQGVNPTKLAAVMKDQTRLNQQIATGLELTKAMQVTEIPAIIINGKYLISNRYTQGDNKKFIATLNYLIQSQ